MVYGVFMYCPVTIFHCEFMCCIVGIYGAFFSLLYAVSCLIYCWFV